VHRVRRSRQYTLLARHENLSLEGRKSLKLLLTANKRLNTAYVLKESFSQLWNYEREGCRTQRITAAVGGSTSYGLLVSRRGTRRQ
jgi:transposase